MKKKKEQKTADLSKVEPVLDTWIFTEEREERIVPLTLEMPQVSDGVVSPSIPGEKSDENRENGMMQPMPLPKYFAELYSQFPEL